MSKLHARQAGDQQGEARYSMRNCESN